MKKSVFENNPLLLVLITIFVLFTSLGVYLFYSSKDKNTSDTLMFEPNEDCVVSEGACEDMDLLSVCPDGSICKEMLVGWSSGDPTCPMYTVRCFEEMD